MIVQRQKQKRARLPRGEGQERPYRGRMQGNAHELCDWVRRRNKLPKAPSLNEALKGKRIPHFLKIAHLI